MAIDGGQFEPLEINAGGQYIIDVLDFQSRPSKPQEVLAAASMEVKQEFSKRGKDKGILWLLNSSPPVLQQRGRETERAWHGL